MTYETSTNNGNGDGNSDSNSDSFNKGSVKKTFIQDEPGMIVNHEISTT